MAQSAPHYSTYDNINKLRKLCGILFWLIFALAIFETAFSQLSIDILQANAAYILQVSNIVSIISIIIFFIAELVVDLFLVPMADNKRRDDFIDNSIGSTFSLEPSEGYYDNSEIQNGIYKVAVNLFENCFFTYNLITKLTYRKIIIPAFAGIGILILAYYGFNGQNTIAVTLLQFMFSTTVLGTLVKHLILLAKLQEIQKDWQNLFSKTTFKTDPESEAASIYRIWLNYETLHSRIPASVPQKVYEQNNPALTEKWIEVKSRYNIS